jgi:hypothetical protein
MYRPISKEKLLVFESLYYNALRRYIASSKNMQLMAGDSAMRTPQTAALVVVAGAMMNTDEFITKN